MFDEYFNLTPTAVSLIQEAAALRAEGQYLGHQNPNQPDTTNPITRQPDPITPLPATSSTGLGSNPVSQQPCMPPIRDDWDRLFQPMFDEYFNPPPIAVSSVQEAAAPRAGVLADSPVSTFIDQDAPSTSIPSSQEHE
ncbi:hypothetical protein Tco_1022229 [Tanacetum coccineum]